MLGFFISLSRDDALSHDLILCNNFEGLQILGQLGRVRQQQTEKIYETKMMKLMYGEKNEQVFSDILLNYLLAVLDIYSRTILKV